MPVLLNGLAEKSRKWWLPHLNFVSTFMYFDIQKILKKYFITLGKKYTLHPFYFLIKMKHTYSVGDIWQAIILLLHVYHDICRWSILWFSMINLIQDCVENLKRNIYRNFEFRYQTIYENVALDIVNIRFLSSIFSN